jgi:subtilisin family serine protease
MNYKAFIAFLFIIFLPELIFPQTTLFVKYKNDIDLSVIENKISSKQFFTKSISKVSAASNFTAGHFAKSLGRSDAGLSRIVKLTFSNTNALQAFLSQIQSDASVEYAQTSNIYKIDLVPNDSLAAEQWALEKIKAFEAWNITEGSDSVIVGLVDTGIDYTHPDLTNKIYINPGETGTNSNGKDKKSDSTDNDNNGFIDDYMGWDFTNAQGYPYDSTTGDFTGWDNNPMDENGHGTYIAGILGAETNNSLGIAGTAPKVRIMNLRAFDPTGNGQEDDVAAAILYAVKMGAKVINMSFGNNIFSYVMRDVIKYAYSKGVVLVASSGNSGSDETHYPSGYSEVICVGNSTEYDDVSPSSNYGSTLDLVAPGTNILTTAKGGGYSSVSGTSASAPFVSAAAGLILSLGNYSNDEVKQIIKTTADDINAAGWDIYTGAGRLNIYRALSSLAPSVIKINSPKQDYSTNSDTLLINATVLSAYFKSCSLYIGTGLNPSTWTTLIQDNNYQFQNKNIYSLNLSSYRDTTYCLRLVVSLSNGQTTEERVNFNIIRTAPSIALIYAGPSLYGNKSTVLASLYTNQLTVIKMYYRPVGSSSFNFVTLDGFAVNTESPTNSHYGFIPKDIVQQDVKYEVYFEAENLAGLKTILNNNGANYVFTTGFTVQQASSILQQYSLPAGEIYENPLSITSNDSNEVALRENSNSSVSYLLKLAGNNFVKFDSLNQQIVKDFGDFNNNGKKDILSYYIYNGYISEQDSEFSPVLEQKFTHATSMFWPILAKDIDKDGKTELLEINSDTSLIIWKVQNDLSLSDSVQLTNFTSGSNILDAPNAVITDMDGDGKNEIWMADEDGDIFSYNIIGSNSFSKSKILSTGMTGSTAYLTAGNYLGDGTKEMAVLLHSKMDSVIAPFYRLLVFDIKSDTINTILDKAFVDPATVYASEFQTVENSIRFTDIDNDGKDELILFQFPNSYIFKNINSVNTIIDYRENINSNSVFVGDLNKNGVPDVAFPTSSGIKFYEFAESKYPGAPYSLSGYSTDSAHIRLNWQGSTSKYYLYKGTSANNLALYDSTATNYFVDSNVVNNSTYYYSAAGVDANKPVPVSTKSNVLSIYSHNPAGVLTVKAQAPAAVLVTLNGKINTVITNLHSFELIPGVYPNSISAASQYSYLLTFNGQLNTGINKLTVNSLTDYYGSPVKQDTLRFTVDSLITNYNFYISSYEILSPYKVAVTFNLDVDASSAINLENYSLTPENHVAGVQVDGSDSKKIYISFAGQKPVGSVGIEYKLDIKNLISSAASGNIKINSGAGSYVVLSGFAKDLSGVYVYPSPVKISGGVTKMTFANLPQRVRIIIYNLSGKRMNEINAETGNGGADYNLKDENGNYLSSGVYLYRISRLDSQNNEVEEKIGKFAVVK